MVFGYTYLISEIANFINTDFYFENKNMPFFHEVILLGLTFYSKIDFEGIICEDSPFFSSRAQKIQQPVKSIVIYKNKVFFC